MIIEFVFGIQQGWSHKFIKKPCWFKLKNCMILKDKNIFIMYKRRVKGIFHHFKNLILLEGVDIDNMQVSSMVLFKWRSYKYFNRHKDDNY